MKKFISIFLILLNLTFQQNYSMISHGDLRRRRGDRVIKLIKSWWAELHKKTAELYEHKTKPIILKTQTTKEKFNKEQLEQQNELYEPNITPIILKQTSNYADYSGKNPTDFTEYLSPELSFMIIKNIINETMDEISQIEVQNGESIISKAYNKYNELLNKLSSINYEFYDIAMDPINIKELFKKLALKEDIYQLQNILRKIERKVTPLSNLENIIFIGIVLGAFEREDLNITSCQKLNLLISLIKSLYVLLSKNNTSESTLIKPIVEKADSIIQEIVPIILDYRFFDNDDYNEAQNTTILHWLSQDDHSFEIFKFFINYLEENLTNEEFYNFVSLKSDTGHTAFDWLTQELKELLDEPEEIDNYSQRLENTQRKIEFINSL